MDSVVKLLSVPELVIPTTRELSFDLLDNAFRSQGVEEHPIACDNWPNGDISASVKFAIAHCGGDILVRYRVKESSIRAQYIEDNESRPFEDSCVELFITPDMSRQTYHNIESNCIGALQFKSGTSELQSRLRHPDEITSQIGRYTTLPKIALEAQEGEFEWSLIMVIPSRLIGFNQEEPLSGQRAYVNLYKCGDKLPHPHYLSWSPIVYARPNFHRPEFFQEIIFG